MAADIGLHGVFLITYSRSGPKLVFHYPAYPDSRSDGAPTNGSEHLGSGLETVTGSVEKLRSGIFDHSKPKRAAEPEHSTSPSSDDGKLFGASEEGLEKLLSPGRWCDKKKFETCLNGLVFVGRPVFAEADGSWTTTRAGAVDNADRAATPTQNLEVRHTSTDFVNTPLGVNVTSAAPILQTRDFTHMPDSLESRVGGLSLGTSFNSNSSISAAIPEPLIAFNVVLATKPPLSRDRGALILAIYEQIVKRLSKALKYCQKKSSYVGLESRKMTQIKAKAKIDAVSRQALLDRLLDGSELARALQEVYEKIKIGAIAGFLLQGTPMSLSLDETSERHEPLDRFDSIILLDDKDVLLRELSHPDASPLAQFIREHTPTKSLEKQAGRLGMSLESVLYLAHYLMKWRKARAIAPLHPRNTYVVSREAPIDELSSRIVDYSRRFAGLPSLPQLLKVLSGRPVRYGLFIPSKDHRTPYMDVLAFLVRHKFVEQLKTSGWLQAPPTLPDATAIVPETNENRRPLSVASLLSPQLKPVADDDTTSVSSERTAIPLSLVSTMVRSESRSDTFKDTTTDPTPPVRMIKHSRALSEEDKLCLNHIRASVEDAELRRRLPSIFHYFDGTTVLEDVAPREALKRSTFDVWLEILQAAGFLLTYRHT